MARRRALPRLGRVCRAAGLCLLLALAASGCARLFGGYDVAPSGLSRRDDALRRMVVAGQSDSALARVAPKGRAAPDDELLRSLYAGLLAHFAGQYAESGAALEQAAELAEDRYTKSLSRAALSLVSSDRVLPYEPDLAERLLVPYYAALNHLRQSDLEAAAVEARRIGFLLEREQDRARDPRSTPLLGFLRYFSGAIFEAAGERNDAGVAYRNAAALLGEDRVGLGQEPLPDTLGEVVVVLERGYVAHRVEQALVVPLHPVEANRIQTGKAGAKLATAALVAARITAQALAEANRASFYEETRPRTLYVDPPDPLLFERECEGEKEGGEHGRKRKPAGCEEGGVPYLLRIAWPVLSRASRPAPGARIVVGPDSAAVVDLRASLSEAVAADFERGRTLMLARTVARATAKLGLTKAVESRAGGKDEAMGKVLGALANLSTALLEQADTRSWQLLPDQLGIVRLHLPPGTHAMALEIPADGRRQARRIDLGTVEVRPGSISFLLAGRSWD